MYKQYRLLNQFHALRFFLCAVAFLLVNHSIGFLGHYGFDDLQYARIAERLLDGQIDWMDHFSYRWTLVGMTALSYAIFGINDFASALPSLLISTGILYLTHLIVRREHFSVQLITFALILSHNWWLFYTDKIMPDIFVGFGVLVAVVAYYACCRNRLRPWPSALLFSLGLLFGFMSKGTILLILPLLIYWFVFDLIKKRQHPFWLRTIASSFILFALYFISIYLLTGNFFARFDAIAHQSYLNPCSYSDQPIEIVLQRISTGLFKEQLKQGMVLSILLAFLTLFFRKHDSSSPTRFFGIATVILVLSANFMSISFSGYNPMCIDPRHYLYLVPIASIAGAPILSSFIEKKQHVWLLALVTVFLAVVIYFKIPEVFKSLYGPLAMSVLAGVVLPREKGLKWILYAIFAISLALWPIRQIKYARKIDYREQKAFVQQHIIDNSSADTVYTDKIGKYLGYYWGGYDSVDVFLEYKGQALVDIDDSSFLLYNPYTVQLSQLSQQELPWYVQHADKILAQVAVQKQPEVGLYRKNKRIETILSRHDKSAEILITRDSSTFYRRQLSDNEFLIKGTFQLKLTSPQSPVLKSMVKNSKNDILITHQVMDLSSKIKTVGHWWPVAFSLYTDEELIDREFQIKLLNTEKAEIKDIDLTYYKMNTEK